MISSYQEMRNKLPMQFKLESYTTEYWGDYICDTLSDLALLPKECAMGSYARVLNPLSIYRKDSAGNWILQHDLEQTAKDGE